MPELPSRPNLDQLRHQARDLLRSAQAGDAEALRRIRVVSDRVALSSAQLALAREHGFTAWRQLVAEIQHRRAAEATAASDEPAVEPKRGPLNPSWSAGSPIRLADGVLQPLGVIPESGEYVLRVVMTEVDAFEQVPRRLFGRRPPALPRTHFDDLTIVDSEGRTYEHRRTRSSGTVRRGRGPARVERADLDVYLDPTPDPGAEWIELRGPSGAATRLLRGVPTTIEVTRPTRVDVSNGEREIEALGRRLVAMRLAGLEAGARFYADRCQAALVRVGELEQAGAVIPTDARLGLTTLCRHLVEGTDIDSIPLRWRTLLGLADEGGGLRRNADLGVDLPPVDGVTMTLGTVAFEENSWCLYARAVPGWWLFDIAEPLKRAAVGIEAADDVGGIYVATFDGGRRVQGEGGEIVRQRFRPRLDPSARVLRFVVRGSSEELVVDVPLPPPR